MSTKTIVIIFGAILLAVILARSNGETTVAQSWHTFGLYYIRLNNGHVYEASACDPNRVTQGTWIKFRALGFDVALGRWHIITPIILTCQVMGQPMQELPLPP